MHAHPALMRNRFHTRAGCRAYSLPQLVTEYGQVTIKVEMPRHHHIALVAGEQWDRNLATRERTRKYFRVTLSVENFEMVWRQFTI